MRLTWNEQHFPASDGWMLADYGGRLFCAGNLELNLPVLACDTETGEVWIRVMDDNGQPLIFNGALTSMRIFFPAPLRYFSSDMVGTAAAPHNRVALLPDEPKTSKPRGREFI